MIGSSLPLDRRLSVLHLEQCELQSTLLDLMIGLRPAQQVAAGDGRVVDLRPAQQTGPTRRHWATARATG